MAILVASHKQLHECYSCKAEIITSITNYVIDVIITYFKAEVAETDSNSSIVLAVLELQLIFN